MPIQPLPLFLRSDSGSYSPELGRIASIQRDFPLIDACALKPQRRLFNHHPTPPMNANSQLPILQMDSCSFNNDSLDNKNSDPAQGLKALNSYQRPPRPYLNETIETAIQTNQLQVIRDWLQAPHTEIDATNSAEETALQIATRHSRMEIVQLLLQNGANINAADDTLGCPALHLAIMHRQKNIVVKLVQAGASLTQRNDANCKNAIELSELHLDPTFKLWLKNLQAGHLESLKKDQTPALIAMLLRAKYPVTSIPLAQLPFQDFHQAEWLGCFSAAIAAKRYDFAAILLAGGLPISIDDLTPDVKNQLHQALLAYKNQYAVLRTQFNKDITYAVFESLEVLPLSMLRALLTYPLELLKKN